ncbi:hypothetical protein SAMN05444159_1233 [Bradyrhizobium lablabi]|uniref:Uncharacterized protein n=1 Tax=Bradyrhizobium lablabi TaxID=722472 RepID=A0A1M6LC12_9BRAD|nr:hypothetical protein [Bradyrhizobium lablabi]SHJ68727.1 hypothetical protein SAMN05444159_1233 [Bradyrhizobium lablabi]
MMPTPNLRSEAFLTATEKAVDNARAKAEIAIEKILLGLEHDTLLRIDQVQVDTRNFANCNVEIFFVEKPPPSNQS